MKRIKLETQGQADILIERVGGSLVVKGWEKPDIRIDFPNENDEFSQEGKRISIRAGNDCILRTPISSNLHIEFVGGDASISGIEGSLSLEHIGGSLSMKRVGQLAIEEVSGNFSARDVKGDMQLSEIRGNLNLRNIHGDLVAEQVSANIDLRETGKMVKVNASGNANLRISLSEDADYQISCAGNAYCRLENTNNVQVRLTSGSERIMIQSKEGNQSLSNEEYEFKIGNGQAKLTIDAEGSVDFRHNEKSDDFKLDFNMEFDEDFGLMIDEISDQVSSQMETQLESLSSQLESLSDHFQISGDRAIKKAQRKVEAAQRRLESKIRARNIKGLRKPAIPSAIGMAHRGEPVSEEERMKVLEMVQQKKISVEEAELLLATLEEHSPGPKASPKSGSANK